MNTLKEITRNLYWGTFVYLLVILFCFMEGSTFTTVNVMKVALVVIVLICVFSVPLVHTRIFLVVCHVLYTMSKIFIFI
jgi:hypothetical protein